MNCLKYVRNTQLLSHELLRLFQRCDLESILILSYCSPIDERLYGDSTTSFPCLIQNSQMLVATWIFPQALAT